MKKTFKLGLLILFLITTGCTSTTYKEISAKDAYQMITTQEVIIVDVRTEEEYETGHLEEAINIPVDKIKERFEKEVTKDKESTIIVYCQSGKRAKDASQTLSNLNYKNVYTFGGINDWTYEIE